MKLREALSRQLTGAANLGASKFRLTLDKEKLMTPHVVMSSVLDILDSRPNLKSGLSDITRFLINDIGFSSDDAKSVEFMTKWMEQRPLIETEIFNFTYLLLGCGTSYTQPVFAKTSKGGKVFDNFQAVPDPSIIYRNMGADEKAKDYWLVEVPIEVRNYEGQVPQYKPIWYIKGSNFNYRYIWCIPYPKDYYNEMVFGHSRNLPYYGSGLLSSSVDDEGITQEILKNWALQAKYRALGKKIIGFYNSGEESVSPSELESIRREFESLEEEDSILVNKRFDQTDLSFNGQDNAMSEQIDWLRKDSGSSLTPNYMTAFSQDASMATASEAKIPFGLQLKSIQPVIIYYLNEHIIKRLKETYTFLSDDLTFTLGTPELYSRDEVFNMIVQLYNNRAATFNELRKSAGLEPVEGGDVWGSEPPLENTKITVEDKALNENPEESAKTKAFKEALQTIKPTKTFTAPHVDVKIPKKGKQESKADMKESVQRFLNGSKK